MSRDGTGRTGPALGDRLRELEEEHAATLAALARAHDDLDRMRARSAREARLGAEAVDRLRGEVREARARAASLEGLQSDSLRLRRIAALIEGSPSAALQNHGLEVLQRSLAGQVDAWRAEAARDRAALLLSLEAEVRHRDTVLGSTSWRLTGPLRRLGRASHVVRREPHRVPGLLVRKLRRSIRRPAPATAPAAEGSSPPLDRPADGLAEAAARIDGELTMISELLQMLSSALEGRDDASFVPAASPGSEAYRAMTHAGKLATWIRHDAARQRAGMP